jgi:hypothetical protein
LTTSGVTAGSYGGITVDAFGRITAVAGGFNPISFISTSVAEFTVSYPSAGTALLTVSVASTLTRGIVRLATLAESTTFATETLALTPGGFKAALNATGETAKYIAGTAALASGALTDVAATYSISGTIKKAMIVAHIRWSPNTTAYDASIFVGGSAVQGSGGAIAGGFRTLIAMVENASGNVEVRPTAPGADTVDADIRVMAFDPVP